MSTFYITTAIDYANSTPHLGTAYEKIGADVIARYRRLKGDQVFFVMGNDEHSQNVRRKAEEMGLDPKKYCDQMAEEFKATWRELHISNDLFIQTSEPKHHEAVRDLAKRIFEAKDEQGRPVIFKAPYEGYYCVSCEAFYEEEDLIDGICPNHKTKPEWIREENYFFRLSAYEKSLRKLFQDHPEFLRPQARRNEVLNVLEKGLEDISISRANKTWGVRLPFDESAVAYVWFDALINYISAVGPIGSQAFKTYWPADLHVVGKDITRFHCLIWPAMLMAAGLPVPKGVWAHGFVSIQGEKMSKSRGNVADPRKLVEIYGAESLRYHLMREVPWDRDGDFSEERLVARHNSDLANNFGNLVNRTLSMVQKYLGSTLKKPAVNPFEDELQKTAQQIQEYRTHMDQFEIAEALEAAWQIVDGSNLFIDQQKPWSLAKDPANREKIETLFYVLLERIRWVAALLAPVLPEKMEALKVMLGLPVSQTTIDQMPPLGSYPVYQLKTATPLFPRFESTPL